jgi:hypothetical protein
MDEHVAGTMNLRRCQVEHSTFETATLSFELGSRIMRNIAADRHGDLVRKPDATLAADGKADRQHGRAAPCAASSAAQVGRASR